MLRSIGQSICRVAVGAALATLLATTAQAETTLEKIKSTGMVTVGTGAAFPPFEFVEDGKIVGYGKDILDYIVADLGVELNQLDLPWQGILPGVLAGKFDFVATSVSVRPERVTKYAFTVPIAEGTNWTMKRKGDGSITSVDDLVGKVVGTQLSRRRSRVQGIRGAAEGRGQGRLQGTEALHLVSRDLPRPGEWRDRRRRPDAAESGGRGQGTARHLRVGRRDRRAQLHGLGDPARGHGPARLPQFQDP